MANIRQVTPLLHVPDFAVALDFFTGVLGFEVLFRMTNYAYVEREGAGVRILEEENGTAAGAENPRTTVYFDVRDVDALYAELKPRLDALPLGNVRGPLNQHWGQRELVIKMPDGDWLAFGQPVESNNEIYE